ncbi:hypothetical protein D4764_13G0006840 [Takifugu flavidus]|uniref:Uncharacterized protein n=1 Tax=Takifugu flavidus TaxID=433684 RepID=A0A5C6P8J5_9TELE|nr:hypothetical protein D4764_13G0006840 [Takifugu flavidus]
MGMADALPLRLLLSVCLLGHIQGESAASLPENPPIAERRGSGEAASPLASPLASRADQRGLLVVGKTAPFCGRTRSHPAAIPQKPARPRCGRADGAGAAGGAAVRCRRSGCQGAAAPLLPSGEPRQPLLWEDGGFRPG